MSQDRRSVLAALGLALPFGLNSGAGALARSVTHAPPTLRFRSFEESVAAAFGSEGALATDAALPGEAFLCRRIEVGHSELSESGVQGCHNDRPFAGFPAGHLRVVRTGGRPGPVFRGVRLYVLTLDVAWTGGSACGDPSRPLHFALLPPAPVFGDERSAVRAGRAVPSHV